ncbi:MAG: lipid-A-disaccharide synthase, partial [Chlorobiaceae bacterium]|nr:lipid-A-disaccharide synthase [Chlorobiaceae bacterium]
KVEFVGHPLLDVLAEIPSLEQARKQYRNSPLGHLIGLLPGSRRQEIALVLPEMLKAARMLAADYDAVFLLGRSPHMDEKHFSLVSEFGDIRIVECTAYEVMRYSELELVTSGTATLESLCFGVPMIVLYKTAWLNYAVGRLLVRLTSISLANIVTKGLGSKDQVVPELIQHKATASEIYMIARRLLDQPALLAEMRQELLDAREKLASASPSLIGSEILQEYL